MDKRNIDDLSVEELKNVYRKNDKIQNKVLDGYMDTELYWIGEMLDYIRPYLSSYSIGFSNRNQHLRVKDKDFDNFIYGLEKLQSDMCFFPEKDAHIINDAMNDLDVDKNDFVKKVLNQFNKFTDFPSYKELEDYFINSYLDSVDYKNFYVDDNNVLYEHVEYEKCYSLKN